MTAPADINPCTCAAWVGLSVDYRTGTLFAKICPDCADRNEAEQEAKRLRYCVLHVPCAAHTMEAIAAITGDEMP